MSKTNIQSNIGKRARFHNAYAYPSLNHRLGTITSDWRGSKGYEYGPFQYGILIDGESKPMAASESEIEILS